MAQPPERTMEQDLLAQVRANSREPGLGALKRLLEIRLRAADRNLRRCPSTEFAGAQAKANLLHEQLEEFWKIPGQPADSQG